MKSGSKLQKIASPILMWGIVFFGAAAVFIVFGGLDRGMEVLLSVEIIQADSVLRFIIVPAVLYWIYFFGSAVLVHREAAESVSGITKVITTGAYAKVRHPIYSADIILSWGIFLYLPNFRMLLCVLWLNVVLFSWMKLEEKLLLEKFGKEYRDYMEKVPMFTARFGP